MNERRAAGASMPLLALGFRVFYLLAGAYAAVSVVGWATQFVGWRRTAPLLASSVWHAHEMFFGYTLAVIGGFLFTAVRNWTQRPTPTGIPLAMLAATWIAGRILVYTPWREVSAVTDMLFALGVATGIAGPLIQSGNRRNYFFVVLVLLIGAANLAYVSALSGWMPLTATHASTIVADLVTFIIAVVAGRVVPMFTNNAVPGAGARRIRVVEYAALGSVLLLLAADFSDEAVWVGFTAAVATLAHAWRLALWAPLKTWRNPLLWILHVSYAWVVAHFALRVATAIGWTMPSVAIHALTIGGIGGMTLGMMTRSALGHTGRTLTAGTVEATCYLLIELAAISRVIVPLLAPWAYVYSVAASGMLWFAAFAVFTLGYWHILSRPRIDGRPG